MPDPNDANIRSADGVVLFDCERNFVEYVHPVRVGQIRVDIMSPPDITRFVGVPIDSTNQPLVQNWRERIARLRA